KILNVSNAASPVLVGQYTNDFGYDTSKFANAVAASGHYVYLRTTKGMHVFDVREPSSPQWVGTSEIAGSLVFANWRGFASRGQLTIFTAVMTNRRLALALGQTSDGLRVLLEGPSGENVLLQRSADLRDWQDWQPVTLGNGSAELSDTNVIGSA